MKIKLFDTHIGKNEELGIQKVLKSKFWASGSGIKNVKKFETNFQKYIQAKSCVAVNNGTSALNLALSLINLKNKEVIVQGFGNVGFYTTKLLSNLGAKILATGDINGYIYNSNGLDINKLEYLIEHK